MRGHLPDESPGFVGRREELEHVSAALTEHRLVTVTGVGGVGKTRFALRAARHVAERFPDGAWWADLTPLDGDRLLVALVADSVDLSDHTPGMATTALRRRLAEDRLLLVLDSCEHLTEPCARLVTELLAAAPGLTVLATSRRSLGVEGEHVVALEPLPPDGPDALELLRTATGETLPAEGPAADICVRLEGIPLALELAAAQIRRVGAEAVRDQLASRPDEPPGARFDLLASTERVWPSRHETLRAAIGWSHALCDPLERLLWARLSVFRGPFDPASATAVCSGGPLTADTLPAVLDGLVRSSVVQPPDAAGRHRMLDTIRAYGATWLDRTGESATVADRHADHFRALARRADTAWLGAPRLRHGGADAHHTDLRRALDHLLRTDPDAALDLIGSVAFAWSCRGHLRESRDGLEQALSRSASRGRARSRALWALGVTLLLQGDFAPAQEVGEQCAREARYAEYEEYAEYGECEEGRGTGPAVPPTEPPVRPERPGPSADSPGSGSSAGPAESGPPAEPAETGPLGSGGAAAPGAGASAEPGPASGLRPGSVVVPAAGPHAEPRPGPAAAPARDAAGGTHGVPPAAGGSRAAPESVRAPARDLTLDAAALGGLVALTTGRVRAAYVVVGHVLESVPGGPGDSAARLRCELVRVFALTGLGRLAEARDRALALRAVCDELDEHWTRTALEYQLALTGLLEGDPVAAARHARAMLDGTRRLGATLGVALGLDVLATALAAAGDAERAADVSGTGEAYWRFTGQPRRGLPGLRALHETYTDAARAAIGAAAYEELFQRALTGLPQDGLDRALRESG
ncbi:regulator [Streptomyces sp. NPDC020807]|uniref:ATP-binding protein n=1 Tax=Streptomyces sp. NPDC020807 TaxID=3155119 RepID=UPI0033D005D2